MKNIVIGLLFGVLMFLAGVLAHRSCPFIKSLVDGKSCAVPAVSCPCACGCATMGKCDCSKKDIKCPCPCGCGSTGKCVSDKCNGCKK